MAKKFLSALLAVLMVISLVPMTAMADVEFAETTPTLVVGVSASPTAAAADAKNVLNRDVTISADPSTDPILWFAMTGLGTSGKYKLTMKNSDGKNILGQAYISYDKSGDNYVTTFAPTDKSTYCLYVSLGPSHAGAAGANKQINSDVLNQETFKSDNFTVDLINANTNKVLATKHVTLAKNTTWTCTQNDTDDLSKIEFRKPGDDVLSIGSKPLGEVQTETPEFALTKTADNKYDVKVTGATLKYAEYDAFSSTNPVMKHGYYAVISVPKVLCGNVVKNWELTGSKTPSIPAPETKRINTESDLNTAFSEYNNSYCDTIIYLGETAEEAKASRPSMKLTYGTLAEQTYTFDFSGMKFMKEELTAKAYEGAKPIDGETDGHKTTNALQSEIVATPNAATKTIIVTGTSYNVKGYTAFSSNSDLQNGHFIALTLENEAEVPMQIYSPVNKDDTATATMKNGWKRFSNKDTVIVRLEGYEKDGYKVKIKVGANLTEGTDWTIDCSGVERREAAVRLEVDPIYTKLDGTLSVMKGSDLQEDITSRYSTDANGVTTIKFGGESKYVAGFDEFDATLNEGNYIALRFTVPEGWTLSGLNWDDGTNAETGVKGQCTFILDGSQSYKQNVTLTKGQETKKYVLDFTGIKRLPAKIDSAARPSPMPTDEPGMDKLKVAYDSTNNKIVLSGLVEGLENNKNIFSDVDLTVKYATNGTKSVVVRFTKNGDVLEAAANPATVAGNTLSFDTSKLLIKSENATDHVDTKAPEAAVSTSIPEEQKKAAEEVAKTLTDNSGKVKVDEDTLEKYANVISNESEAKAELVSDAATIVSANADKVPTRLKNRIDEGDVETVVQAYAKIEVVGVETNDKNEITNFQLDITPMARTIVTTVTNTNNIKLFDSTKDATANVNANAIVVKDEEVAISEATKVTLALPASYKANEAYITHTKDDGTEYHYTGKIEGSNPRTLTFTSEQGFSSFTITSTEPAKSKDATLKSVKVGSTEAVLSGTAYTATLPKNTDLTKQTLTLAATNANAKINVNGNAYTDGMTVDLSAGKTVTIAVTAEDGTTKATYTLTGKLAEDDPSELYTDIPAGAMGEWAKKAINYGIMSSNASGKYEFQPNANTQRKWIALMIARADIMADDSTISDVTAATAKLMADYGTKTPDYKDVANVEDSAKAAIAYCQEKGIMNGDNAGNFNPNKIVDRMEAASILANWLKLTEGGKENTHQFKDWARIPDWAKGNINAVADDGIMLGHDTGNFGTENLTRVQTAVIMVKAYERLAGISE